VDPDRTEVAVSGRGVSNAITKPCHQLIVTITLPYDFPAVPSGKTDQPCLVVPSAGIVDLYNSAHNADKHRKNVRKNVKQWFFEAAKQAGWSQIKFYLEYNAPRSYAALLIFKAQDSI